MNPLNAKRKQANANLCRMLTELCELNPSLRFGQVLTSFGFIKQEGSNWVDEYYLEPDLLEKRVREAIAKMEA